MRFRETKERLLNFFNERKDVYFRHVHTTEYVTRCPYCGDSMKQVNIGHLYMNIDVESDFNIPIICFKCNYTGILTSETLDLMGCEDRDLISQIQVLNKNGKIKRGSNSEFLYLYFDRILPEIHRYPNKINYIENRLGVQFTAEDLKEMKIITSLYDFLIANQINSSSFNQQQRMLLERDYVGFLSSGNSHILFRDTTEKNEIRWIKYPIEEESRRNHVFFGLDAKIDVFTKESITINLSEGIIDVLGVAYHFEYHKQNTFNIGVCSQNFDGMIRHMIEVGAFGENVTLNIFVDNDKDYNKKVKYKESIEKHHKRYLEKYKPLFNSINLYYNLRYKDYGTQKDNIVLEKKRI